MKILVDTRVCDLLNIQTKYFHVSINVCYLLIICESVPILNTKQTPYSLHICPKHKQKLNFCQNIFKVFSFINTI